MGLAPVRTASLSWATEALRAGGGGGRQGARSRCRCGRRPAGGAGGAVLRWVAGMRGWWGPGCPPLRSLGAVPPDTARRPPSLASLAPPLPPAAKSPKEKVEEAVEAPQVTEQMHPKRYPKQFKTKQGSF